MPYIAFPARTARSAAVVLVSTLAVAASLSAQVPRPPAPPPAKAPKTSRRGGWKLEFQPAVAVRYDDNVFHLAPDQRNDLNPPSAAAVTSRRYTGMENASDVIATGTLAVQVAGDGIGGRRLEITPEISYDYASRNELRREGSGALTIAQSFGNGRRVRLLGASTPSHFSRNYLSDAVDADRNGSIFPAERIYSRGQYGDYSIGGDVRLPLMSGSKRGVVLTAGGGYYARSYDAPFAVRDLSGPTAMAALAIGQKSPIGLQLDYELAALSAAPGRQVALLDEASYNVDFNGNGRRSDIDARALVDIDRSRVEHQLGAGLTFDAGRHVTALLGYDYRLRSFHSKLPYDEDNAGRRDSRNGIRGSLRARVAKGISMSAGARFLTQSTNRPLGSSAGEEADYRNLIVSVGLQAAF